MTGDPGLSGLDTAAQQLVRDAAQTVPVTVASIALWDRPSFALRVTAMGTLRGLDTASFLGAWVPLARAGWHRRVFERQEPLLIERGELPDEGFEAEAGLSLIADLQSVYLLPIRAGDETVGILSLGEMRSRDRQPFTEERRERCRSILEEFLVASADAWEAARLRRQARAMSSLLATVPQFLEARSFQDVLACCASELAGWLGTPVRGILLRPGATNGMEVAARWRLPETVLDDDAACLLMALTRERGRPHGPATVVGVADDPLDPLHQAFPDNGGLTRIALPLLQRGRLLGVACLYVEDELCPTEWELDALRRRGDVAALGMGRVEALEEYRQEQEWMGRAARDLLTAHQRTVVDETLSAAMRRLSEVLPAKVAQVGAELGGPPDWRALGEAVAREVTTVMAGLRDQVEHHEDQAALPLDMNAAVRRAIQIAGAKWEATPRRANLPVQVSFEPAAETLVADASPGFVGALVHAIDDAVEAMPEGGRVDIRTARDNGHVLIAVGESGGGVPNGHDPYVVGPLFSDNGGRSGLGLSILRAVAGRHGGTVSLAPFGHDGTLVEIRLPVARLSLEASASSEADEQ